MRPENEDAAESERRARRERVKQELGITEESLKRDVPSLQHWLHRQPHLGTISGVNEEKWLANYLAVCKNSMTKAKHGIDLYFRLRSSMPELFYDRDASTPLMQASFKATCLAFLPQLTAEGYRVIVYTHFTDDASQFDPITLAKRILMMLDINLYETVEHTGVLLLADLGNSRRGHLARYPLTMINKMLTSGWKAYPERLAGIHVINPPPFLETALNIFKPFLADKIKERIKVHNSLQSLCDSIPAEILPCDYNGKGPSLNQLNREWQTKMIENRAWLDESAKHCSNEALRVADKNEDELEGSFRQLAID